MGAWHQRTVSALILTNVKSHVSVQTRGHHVAQLEALGIVIHTLCSVFQCSVLMVVLVQQAW